jgi:preprotein translocase subunit YajC
MTSWISFIAQTTPASPTPGQPGAGAFFLPAMMLAFLAFLFLSSRSQKKREKREREEMHEKLGKNTRVLTVGGVIGTVVSVKDTEVVVKVDESTNTKMTFLKTSIQRVLSDEN